MACADFEERILNYLDGGLPAPERRLLEAHLLKCADCREFRDLQENLDALLAKSLVMPQLSEDFGRRVLRRLPLLKPVHHIPEILDALGYASAAVGGGFLLQFLLSASWPSLPDPGAWAIAAACAGLGLHSAIQNLRTDSTDY